MVNPTSLLSLYKNIEQELTALSLVDLYDETIEGRVKYNKGVFIPSSSKISHSASKIEAIFKRVRKKILADKCVIADEIKLATEASITKEEIIDLLKKPTTSSDILSILDEKKQEEYAQRLLLLEKQSIFMHQILSPLSIVTPIIIETVISKEIAQNIIIKSNLFIMEKIAISKEVLERIVVDTIEFEQNKVEHKYDCNFHSVQRYIKYLEKYKEKFKKFKYNNIEKEIKLVIENQTKLDRVVYTDFYKSLEIIEVVLFNAAEEIISNDIKIRRVEITILDKSKMVEILIRDYGTGIDNVHNVFKMNYTTKAEKGGTGIGLAIGKSISEDLGISIGIKTKKMKGTLFSILIPTDIFKKAAK